MAPKPKIVETGEKLKDSAVRIKDSAAHMERSTARVEDSADRRTELAADRTVFAAERTYAAWVRTGLVAMASGIGAKALLADFLPHWLVMTSGSVFILFSVFCFGAGVWRHLYPGPPPPVPDASRIHPAILVCVNSILGLVSIAALVGIWLDPGQRSTGIGLPDILSIEDARTLTQCQCPTAFRRSQTQYRARWAPCFRIRGNNC